MCMLLSTFRQLYTSGHVSVGDPDSLRAFRACTGGVQTTFSPTLCDSRWACADSPTAEYSLHSCAQPLAILVLPPSMATFPMSYPSRMIKDCLVQPSTAWSTALGLVLRLSCAMDLVADTAAITLSSEMYQGSG